MAFTTAKLLITPQSLPSSFRNRIISVSENSTLIRSNVQCMEDINLWLKDFGSLTHTKWNSRSSKPSGVKIVCSKKFVCHHASFMKVTKEENKKGLSKNANCPASILVKIKVDSPFTRRDDELVKEGLLGIIDIKNLHTHSLETAETLRFLPADSRVKQVFHNYFNTGMSVAESCRYHEGCLELQDECTEATLANGMTNPTRRTVQNWHEEWRLLNLRPRTGQGLIEKLKEKQKNYEEQGIKVTFQEHPFAVAVVTPLMQRPHQLESSQDIIFIDSTSSCDAEGHTITFVLTPCPAGASPLGIIITKGQTCEAYTAGFQLLRNTVKDPFNGKGYPQIILTDHSQAEISAIQSVWPESKNYLCIFHVLQAVWRRLWEAKHLILKDDRPKLMAAFQEILYSLNTSAAEEAFRKAIKISKENKGFQNYLADYWKIKELWCLAWRDTTSKGHHTNNFSEVSVRLFKDVVLSRVKAYNVIALVDFTCTTLEEYYCHRFREFANNRSSSARLFLRSLLKKANYVTESDIIQNGAEFYVPSDKNDSVLYTVNTEVSSCSCATGQFGKFCKHQCIIYKLFDVASKNFPPVSSKDRYTVAVLALGEKVPPISFYQPFLLDLSDGITPDVVHEQANREQENEQANHDQAHENATKSSSHNIPSQTSPNTSNASELQRITQILYGCDEKFGSTASGLKKFRQRLEKLCSVGQWETFLHTAGSNVPIRRRHGAAIHVHATSLA